MRTSRRVAYVALLLVVFVVLDVVLSYTLVPYGSKSEIVWHDYHAQESVDTVIVGDSIAQQGVDPFILDDELGANCINMASPNQHCEESYVALKEIFSQHEVKTVYYCIEFSQFRGNYSAGPQSTFLFEKWRYDSPAVVFSDFFTATKLKLWAEKPESINWLFPWVTNHLPYDVGKICDNIRMRLDGTPVGAAAEKNENGWKYQGKGFGNYGTVADFNELHQHYASLLENRKHVAPEKQKALESFCSLCKENGTRLVVVVMPLATYNLFGVTSNYESYSKSVKDCVVKNGGEYYDFNLAKPELFDNEDELFVDFEHLNTIGADTFTRSLARFLKEKEAGSDTDSLFYTFKERLESTNTVQCVDIEINVGFGDVGLTAVPCAKENLNAEYRFVCQREGDSDWTEIRGYAPEATCSFTLENRGTYTFRVYARTVGVTQGEYDCYYQQTVVV